MTCAGNGVSTCRYTCIRWLRSSTKCHVLDNLLLAPLGPSSTSSSSSTRPSTSTSAWPDYQQCGRILQFLRQVQSLCTSERPWWWRREKVITLAVDMICGYVDIWICGYDMWICGYMDMWICGYVDMWICVCDEGGSHPHTCFVYLWTVLMRIKSRRKGNISLWGLVIIPFLDNFFKLEICASLKF